MVDSLHAAPNVVQIVPTVPAHQPPFTRAAARPERRAHPRPTFDVLAALRVHLRGEWTLEGMGLAINSWLRAADGHWLEGRHHSYVSTLVQAQKTVLGVADVQDAIDRLLALRFGGVHTHKASA